MDRLSIVIAAAALAGLACNDKGSSSGARERVNAVKAAPKAAVDPAAMCDKHYPGDDAPAYVAPDLLGPVGVDAAPGWRWVNVWATWCKPCVAELPRLAEWNDRLRRANTRFSLDLISADEADEDVAGFVKQHASSLTSKQLADPDDVEAWLAGLGLKGATLPVHIFVDPAGKVRCLRASEVEESDYPAIAALMAR